jgi:hypothetical protein
MESASVNPFFGDIVIYWGKSFDAWVLNWYTNSRISHAAVRTSEHEAISADILEEVMKHNLRNPRNIYYAYAILRHKEMTLEKRAEMKEVFDEILPVLEYDFARIARLAARHLKSQVSNLLTGRDIYDFPQDRRDITTNPEGLMHLFLNKSFLPVYRRLRGFNGKNGTKNQDIRGLHPCSSLVDFLNTEIGLLPSVPQVHYSQTEPHQLLENLDYDVVDLWVRPGYAIKNPEEVLRLSSCPTLLAA